jgi:hypothetical protein
MADRDGSCTPSLCRRTPGNVGFSLGPFSLLRTRPGAKTVSRKQALETGADIRVKSLPIAFGVLVVVAVIMGLRLSLDHLAEQPIVGPYKSFIELSYSDQLL